MNNDNDLTNSNVAPPEANKLLQWRQSLKTSSLHSMPFGSAAEGQGRKKEDDEESLTSQKSDLLTSMADLSSPSQPPAAPLSPSRQVEMASSSSSVDVDVRSRAFGVHQRHHQPTEASSRKIKKKIKKKFKKFLFPLLLAYKLKFMALIPLLIGGLTLLVGSTGLAGFFFALFAAVMSLKGGHSSHRSLP